MCVDDENGCCGTERGCTGKRASQLRSRGMEAKGACCGMLVLYKEREREAGRREITRARARMTVRRAEREVMRDERERERERVCIRGSGRICTWH